MSNFDEILASLTANSNQTVQTPQSPQEEGSDIPDLQVMQSFVPAKQTVQEEQAKQIKVDSVYKPDYTVIAPNFEALLVKTSLERQDYFNKIKPVLNKNVFNNHYYFELFDMIKKHYDLYKVLPSIPEIHLQIREHPKKEDREKLSQLIFTLGAVNLIPRDFMDDYTVRYIKNQMFEKALIIGADFVDKKDEKSKQKAKDLIDESQKITLNSNLGDTFSDYEARLEYYQNPEKGLTYTDFKAFNDCLGGGMLPGTLNIFLAPPGIGKSMMLSFSMSDFMKQGKNVLLISMEMSNFEFLKRVDANLLDIPIYELSLPSRKDEIISKFNALKKLNYGELYVQNYPPNSFSAYTLEALLDLYDANNIKIDIIMLDYLGLMKSDKLDANVGLYSYYKTIGEEVRAVAKQLNKVVISCSQLNRSTYGKEAKEVDNSSISDSMGTAMTADLMVMMLQTETQKLKGEITFKITKNRYTGKTTQFNAGADYRFMRYLDAPLGSQNSVITMPSIQQTQNPMVQLPQAPQIPQAPQELPKPKSTEFDDIFNQLNGADPV